MSVISLDHFKLNSIYVIEAITESGLIKRGTCFSISKKILLTANHVIDINPKYIRIYLSSDDYSKGNYIESKCIYCNKELDIAIIEILDFELNHHINLYSTNVGIDNEVLSCGYPAEKDIFYEPIKVKISNDLTNVTTSNYSFEVTQATTVTNYSGMSGSPVIYNNDCIGILVYQQGKNTLYGISIKDVLKDINILNIINENFIKYKIQNGIDYNPPKHPLSPFKYCVNCNASDPNIKGIDIGFEFGEWKINNFSETVYDWLIDYALTLKEQKNFNGSDRQLFKFAKDNFLLNNLDALGDLCLHIAIRETYKTIPVMNKLFDINNKTFSCTHAVLNFDSLELWIGASSVNRTLEEVIESIVKNIEYIVDIRSLKNRLFALTNQIDDSWPHKEKLERLSDANLSIDERFDKIIIPIFLMHDSDLINNFDKENFIKLFEDHVLECRNLLKSNINDGLVKLVDLRVFCFPVSDIQKINDELYKELS